MKIFPLLLSVAFFYFLISCNKTSQVNKLTDSVNMEDTELTSIHKGQEYIYSSIIPPNSKRIINGKELCFVQELFDSLNLAKGSIYVELINDSVFRSLYIFNKNDLKYYVGEGILTNLADTESFNKESYYGLKFVVRSKNYVGIEIADKNGRGVSDSRTIQYLQNENKFGNPDVH